MRRTPNKRRQQASWGCPPRILDMNRINEEFDLIDNVMDAEERELVHEYGLGAVVSVLHRVHDIDRARYQLELARKIKQA